MLETLLERREIGALPREEAGVAHALRLWVTMRKSGRCAMQAVAGRLGSLQASAHFHLLLEGDRRPLARTLRGEPALLPLSQP